MFYSILLLWIVGKLKHSEETHSVTGGRELSRVVELSLRGCSVNHLATVPSSGRCLIAPRYDDVTTCPTLPVTG